MEIKWNLWGGEKLSLKCNKICYACKNEQRWHALPYNSFNTPPFKILNLYDPFFDQWSIDVKSAVTRENCPLVEEQKLMKQRNVVVSPPAFVWNPYMTLTNVTFDPNPCDL